MFLSITTIPPNELQIKKTFLRTNSGSFVVEVESIPAGPILSESLQVAGKLCWLEQTILYTIMVCPWQIV